MMDGPAEGPAAKINGVGSGIADPASSRWSPLPMECARGRIGNGKPGFAYPH